MLYAADIIKSTGWFSYEDPADPMLRRYIEYQHKREVEQLAPEVAVEDLISEVNRIRGDANRQVGHLADEWRQEGIVSVAQNMLRQDLCNIIKYERF